MKNNSPFKRTFCDGWDLVCDRPLPKFCYPAETPTCHAKHLFNPLYTVAVYAAAAGVAVSILGRILAWLLPSNGAAVVFAATVFIFCEIRTNFRGLALSISFLEKLLYGKKFAECAALRQDDLRNISGLVPLLLAVAALGTRFFALFVTAKSGNYGVVGAAWIIALSAEGFLAAEPGAANVPDFCSQAKGEYIVATAGFFLLFILIYQPLAALIAVGISAVLVIILMNVFLRKTGSIVSNDITMTGYFLELTVLLTFVVMIG